MAQWMQTCIDNTKYHSTCGEQSTSYAPYRSPMADAYLQAVAEFCYRVIDYNGETNWFQLYTNNDKKWNPNERIKSISVSDKKSQELSRDKEQSCYQTSNSPGHQNHVWSSVCS
jgi:hypothetical protein